MAMIALRNVRKSFGRVEVIRGADLRINDSEFVVFVGPSGCGKSTLLRLLAGLENLTEGAVDIDGARVDHLPPAKRGIAMVFQTYALYPHMTVRQNMSYALRVAGAAKDEIESKVRSAAGILQLTDYLDRKPKELSGGQRQRVAIGRAIVRDPKVFLFDEPLSNLDAKLRVQMRIEITKLHKRLNATMIYVTHDQVEAMTMADRIVVMRNGGIEQVGAPLELYNRPVNSFVAGFIGSPAMNMFDGRAAGFTESGLEVEFADSAKAIFPCGNRGACNVDGGVTVGIRPEHFTFGRPSDGVIGGEVHAVERLGNETFAYAISAGGRDLVIHSPGDRNFTVGDRIRAGYSVAASHLFDADGRAVR